MSTYDISNFETGDIILFNGYYGMSKIIETFTGNRWSHVGMVIKDPDFLFREHDETKNEPIKGIFLYEADGIYLNDIDSGQKLFGVQLIDLQQKINVYQGNVSYRKLYWHKKSSEIHNILETVYNTTYHKPYDWYILDLIEPKIYKKYWFVDQLLEKQGRRTDSFFCSSFIAYIYTQLGLLDKKTNWSLIYPQFFADTIALNDAHLGDIVEIKKLKI